MTIATIAAQTAIRTASGNSINAGIWTLVGIAIVTIGGIIMAVVKQWGPWKQVDNAKEALDFERLRTDIARQEGRILNLETLVTAANNKASDAHDHAMRSDAKLQTALTACEVLLGLVEREMPGASEIPLVKRLLAQAAADDMGIGAGMRKIAMMKGVGE